MQFQLKEFKDLFLNDYQENLDNIYNLLSKLEENPENKELCNELLRFMHNIKGTSASVGLKKTSELAQLIEEIFDKIRKGSLNLNPSIIKNLFTAVDFLKMNIINIRDNDSELETEEIKKVISPEGKEENSKNKKNSKSIISKNFFEIDSVKISAKKIDSLMQNIGFMLVHSMNFKEMIGNLIKKTGKTKEVENLEQIYNDFTGTLEELKFFALNISLIDLEILFTNLPRLVKNSSELLEKEIKLKISGEKIKVDRLILNKLYDPLIHIIRNAIDHGIKEKGEIKIEAKQEENYVEILITDNGEGIDFKKVINKAFTKGIINNNEKTNLEKLLPLKKNTLVPLSLKDLLFENNISTSEKITSISGRGMGLAQVEKFIDAIGGNLAIKIPERGTSFIIQIPYSIALIKVLLIKIGENIFAIPPQYIKSINDNEREETFQTLPFLGITEIKSKRILVLKNFEQEAKIPIEDIVGIQDILLKPLPNFIFKEKYFIGAALLDTGKLALVLDIPLVLRKISKTIYI